ncbi:YqiJ family protein [Streptomyces gobiensis]|uniref:YqiJ family protein n=1 Tax=Streptomyces gobiensis TaxID=2875706 RepID=UPI001E61A254|nr:YqiJ family protein [Streptomyces gobiensis]UGY91501.1 YqiJ family protein [Streptomyces gobiensis]
MGEFMDAALAFPAVLFTFALVVVIAYWLLVLVGGAGVDALDGGEGVDSSVSPDTGGAGFTGAFAAFGLGGVPVTIVLSLLTAIAWFVSLAGAVLFDNILLRMVLLPVALVAAWSTTWVLVRPLRRLAPVERGISRTDFVGRVCVIRTGRVAPDFGQAEVAAEDGSTAIIQVRTEDSDVAGSLTSGSSALIFDYDAEGEFFRVAPYDSALDPGQPMP